MSLPSGVISACVALPISVLGGLIWYWRRSSQGKVCREWFGGRQVGAKKQERHLRQEWPYAELGLNWKFWLSPRSVASVEDVEEGRVSYAANLPGRQPSRSDDVQANPSRPPPTYRPQSFESGSIPLIQFTHTCYLRIIVFTTSPQIPCLPDIQMPELPGVVFILSINPTLQQVVDGGGRLKDIDWERCQRGSISEFRIIEESGVIRDDADGVLDATPGHGRNALARPLHAVPEDFSIKSELKVLARKIMEQEGYWQPRLARGGKDRDQCS